MWAAEGVKVGKRERAKKKEREKQAEREREIRGVGRNGVLHEEHWASRRRRGERGMEGGSKGGRQLLKAIALPPGCLRRAESVEMLNLA